MSEDSMVMKRRDFLKTLVMGSVIGIKPPRTLQGMDLPDIALIQGDSPSKITKEAVEALGGMNRFVSRGDVVLVKPNIAWDRTPQLAACTNPEVVKALVELSFDAGAKEVIVMDNPTNPATRTYARSGIASAAREAGANVQFPNPHRLKKIPIHGEWLKEWEVFTNFIEADKLINVPIAKTHSLSKVTLGMKNWLGALGGNRGQLHQKLDQVMVDVAAFFKPSLTVLDAYRILVRNGPQGGRLSDVELFETMVAGVDYVAIDALGATFFGLTSHELPYLQLAHKMGHGEINLEKLKFVRRKIPNP